MITLKDYIGKIYKEVTNAKVQSDIETLAIAQEYVENPMLKHFAVPNIRIKDMQLTIPVAVDTTQTVARSYTESEVQKVYEDAFTKVTTDSLADRADEHNAYLQSIQPELATKAQVEATATVSRLQQAEATAAPEGESADGTTSAEYANALNISANKFVDVSFAFLTDLNIEEPVFRTAMVQEIEQNLQPRTPEIQDLPVIVETQRLEAINDPTNLISIKINITDDAMEWTTDVDENGNTVQRLDYL